MHSIAMLIVSSYLNSFLLSSADNIRKQFVPRLEDVATVRSSKLLAKLEHLDLILRERRLRWCWHVERSSGAIRTACDIQIEGWRVAGRPKLTWKKLMENECHEWKLTTVDLKKGAPGD